MALIVEDGSIVENANSYVDLSYARAYANQRGITLPVGDTECEVLLIKAMDFIEALRSDFKGDKTDPENQNLQWPRYPVLIDSVYINSDAIPEELKKAQSQLAIEINAGIDIMPTRKPKFVTQETVGPITKKYSDTVGTGPSPVLTAVDNLLKPLLKSQFTLETVRV